MTREGIALALLLAPAAALAECTIEHLEKIAAFHGTVVSSSRLPLTRSEFDEEVLSEKKTSCPAGETDDACTARLTVEVPEGQRIEVDITGAPEKYSFTVESERDRERRTFLLDSPEEATAWLIAEQTAGRRWIFTDMHRVTDPVSVRVARVRVLKLVPVQRVHAPGLRATIATKDPSDIAIRKLMATTNGFVDIEAVHVDRKPRIDGQTHVTVVLRCPAPPR